MHEESINYILLHCAKTRTLWALFFTLFGVQWVLLASVKMMLLGRDGSFVGKKRREVWRADPLCIFWTVWKVRNRIAFENDLLSIQRLKSSFVYFIWSEMKLFIKDGPSTLVGFIDWVGYRWGWFFWLLCFWRLFLCPNQGGGCISFVFFWVAILASLFNTISFLPLKKKKKKKKKNLPGRPISLSLYVPILNFFLPCNCYTTINFSFPFVNIFVSFHLLCQPKTLKYQWTFSFHTKLFYWQNHLPWATFFKHTQPYSHS